MLINGKSLQDWKDEPAAGKFSKAVRESIDPHWGRECGEKRAWKIHVKMWRKERDEENFVVEAFTKEEAKDLAYDEIDGDSWEETEIDADEIIEGE